MDERMIGSEWMNGWKDDWKWMKGWMNEWIKNQCLDDAVHRLRLTPEIWSGQGLLGLKIR